jgi:hypothetical protein
VLADLEKLKSNLVANTKTSIYNIARGVGSNSAFAFICPRRGLVTKQPRLTPMDLKAMPKQAEKVSTSTVLTIGHSTRTWKDFLDLLRAHRIERVIDVRTLPRSLHNPQFDQKTLRTKLRGARIGYVHLPKLGGLRHARPDSSNMGWRNSSFRGFADYMQTSDFDAGLQRLIKLAGQKRCAVMCAEAVPWRCHRSLIADALTVLGIRVEDIMSKNRTSLHHLTSFGRVRHGHITYPTSKDRLLPSSLGRTPRKENGLGNKGYARKKNG